MNSQDKAIVYDDSCPMCQLYTQGFVRAGMLKQENRIAFSCLPTLPVAHQIDMQRSRHEIPLIDMKGGKTLYGLDSLLYMIGSRMPLLARIGKFAPIYFFFTYFYAFISYNRRVIIQAPKTMHGFNCAPDFHVVYRLSFIALGLACGVYYFGISWQYALYVALAHYALPFLPKHQRTELLGQLAVSTFIGLLFLPLHFTVGVVAFLLSYGWRLSNSFQNLYVVMKNKL